MSTVFPFHLVFDHRGNITQYGDNLPRLCPALTLDAPIGELFRILTPIGLSMTPKAIASQLFSVFFVQCVDTGHVIKGQMVPLDGAAPGSMMFLCSPLVHDMGSVKSLGLSFNDFALHDATVDFLFLLQTKVNTIDDVRTLAEQLRQEVQVRRQAQLNLQTMNTELEQRVEQRTADLLIAKDKAETANKTKSTFLSNMSHELRTPLNAILGYAQIMQRDDNLDARQLANLQTINDSGDHLLTLITDLLDLAKIEAGKSALYLSPVMLCDFMVGVTAMLRVRAQQKGLAIVCDRAPDLLPLVLMDEKRVRQVLLNLLNNAVKFTERGQVTLRVSHLSSRVINGARQACLRFEIEDSGIGIHADHLEIIFQPFEQVGEQKNQSSGTGLGLSISAQLIDLMNSKIYVDSAPGKGSTFWFDLILAMPEFEFTADHKLKGNGLSLTLSPPDNNLATLIPPPEEIEKLYHLALTGNMRKITQYAAQLLAVDCRYRLFTDQLNSLAREYQTKAILKLIEAHMTGSV